MPNCVISSKSSSVMLYFRLSWSAKSRKRLSSWPSNSDSSASKTAAPSNKYVKVTTMSERVRTFCRFMPRNYRTASRPVVCSIGPVKLYKVFRNHKTDEENYCKNTKQCLTSVCHFEFCLHGMAEIIRMKKVTKKSVSRSSVSQSECVHTKFAALASRNEKSRLAVTGSYVCTCVVIRTHR